MEAARCALSHAGLKGGAFEECHCRLKNPQFAPIENSHFRRLKFPQGAERL
jgi:hypothetical protein